MSSSNLAIAIATYNRSEILRDNILYMLPKLMEQNIPIYISDDSNNNDTQIAIDTIKNDYPLIHYRRNHSRLGHDANYMATVTWPETEYVWYLGDSMIFDINTLGLILDAVQHGPDFIFLNSHGGRASFTPGFIDNESEFLSQNIWHLTLTGSTIYQRKYCDWLKTKSEHVAKYPNFIQIGCLLDYCHEHQGRFYGLPSINIEPNRKKTSYWQNNAIKVFAHDWLHTIEASKIFTEQQKKEVIYSHSKNTGLFGVKSLFSMRAEGNLDKETLNKYKVEAQKTFYPSYRLAQIITHLPLKIIKPAVISLKKSRDLIKKITN